MIVPILFGLLACAGTSAAPPSAVPASAEWPADPASLSDEAWKQRLSAEQYRILRQKGTERAFTGPFVDNKEAGVYRCAGCGTALFSSQDKFDSGTGWPSYTRPVASEAVKTEVDASLGMVRTEALCGTCGGHLGHVFDDGPKPTGQRWCINGHALVFEAGAPSGVGSPR